jgi:3-oxoacyl-[acyl-carrier protein] reductase
MNIIKRAARYFLDKAIRALGKASRSRAMRILPSVEEAQRSHEYRMSQFRLNLDQGRLAGKVAIITGGANGIGLATGMLFAREGAKVVVADRTRGAFDQIESKGGDIAFVQTDLLADEQIKSMVEATVLKHGKIDILVNNAGIVSHGNAVDVTMDTWQRTLDINLTAAYRCCHYVIPHIVSGGGGSVIMIASINGGTCGIMDSAAYATSKAGLIGLTLQTAREFASRQVRVNSVSPGVIRTALLESSDFLAEKIRLVSEYTPLGFIGIAEDVAYANLFLASDESSYITGTNIIVDGGITMRGT